MVVLLQSKVQQELHAEQMKSARLRDELLKARSGAATASHASAQHHAAPPAFVEHSLPAPAPTPSLAFVPTPAITQSSAPSVPAHVAVAQFTSSTPMDTSSDSSSSSSPHAPTLVASTPVTSPSATAEAATSNKRTLRR